MGIDDKLKGIMDDFDFDQIRVSLNVAKTLLLAGYEILQLLDDKNQLSDIELLEIIEKANVAQIDSRKYAIDQIKARRERELAAKGVDLSDNKVPRHINAD